jgi:hypothetical protein
MTRLPKIQRLAMEHGANLTEHEDGWYWDIEQAMGKGPFEFASHAAYDFLDNELDEEIKQRRAVRRALLTNSAQSRSSNIGPDQ